jgi:predicted RNase H-like HicB family nuclease
MISTQPTEQAMEYIAYLHKDPDSDFGVSFPDFPGCVTAGKTLEEARRMATEALALHVEGLLEDGREIPEPSSLDALAGDPSLQGAVAFMVSLKPAEKRVRINITARESQLAAIDRLAGKAGLTRSAYMVQSSLGRPGRAGRRNGRGVATRGHRLSRGRKIGK